MTVPPDFSGEWTHTKMRVARAPWTWSCQLAGAVWSLARPRQCLVLVLKSPEPCCAQPDPLQPLLVLPRVRVPWCFGRLRRMQGFLPVPRCLLLCLRLACFLRVP